MAGVDFGLPYLTAGEQILSPGVELGCQAGYKTLCLRCQDLGVGRSDGSSDLELQFLNLSRAGHIAIILSLRVLVLPRRPARRYAVCAVTAF